MECVIRYPSEDRDPLETFLQDDAYVPVSIHKVRQTPGIPPVCIDLQVVRVMSLLGVSLGQVTW